MACQRMISALEDYVVLGIQTSIDFLKDVIGHPEFQKGETTTHFIERHFDTWEGKKVTEETQKLAALAVAFDSANRIFKPSAATEHKEVYSPWLTLGKWQLGGK